MAVDAAGPPALPLRLHIGCGPQHLDGWVNIDLHPGPGVDRALDVRDGLPFRGAEIVYAEHFLEHLTLDEGLAFLRDAHRALAPAGVLRLSTPNLDWVVRTQYTEPFLADAARAALRLNHGFHAWSHRFLWNRALLGEALAACGFVDVRWHVHGESERPLLRGLERHETYPDTPDMPHVLVVEAARGEGEADPARLAALRALLSGEFLDRVRPLGWRVDPQRSVVRLHVPVGGVLGGRVRQHVVRCCWVGGAVHHVPEALQETRVEIGVDARHVVVDEPHERALRELPAIPQRVRRALEARLRGAQGIDAERLQTVVFRSSVVRAVEPGRVRVEGELRAGARTMPLTVDAAITRERGEWWARAAFPLRWSALELPPWRAWGGLLRGGDEFLVEMAIVAEAVMPT